MSDLLGLFRATTATEAAARHCDLPARAELMDISCVPFAQTDFIGSDELGFLRFANEQVLGGTAWKQAPFVIRITPKGGPSFLVDFHWPPPVAQGSVTR
jgi:hypothetical protein